MKIEVLKYDFIVCKTKEIPTKILNNDFCFIGKTDEEVSVVCPIHCLPENTIEESRGWKAFRICGVLNFSLIGILAEISELLAKNNISIFVISTFNTDYILVKKENLNTALYLLEKAGYVIIK